MTPSTTRITPIQIERRFPLDDTPPVPAHSWKLLTSP